MSTDLLVCFGTKQQWIIEATYITTQLKN